MPALATMLQALPPWAPSPVPPMKLCGSKRTMQVVKKRSASSAHRLMAATATATAPAICEDGQPRLQAMELLRCLEEDGWVEDQMLSLLSPVDEAWQPADLLPTFAFTAGAAAEEQRSQEVAELQARAAGVPDELLVCLVGNMVTEEALPTYMTMANRVGAAAGEEGRRLNDATGCDGHGWARWLRGWTAEENRHGDLLNRYLYLCGRVDMRQVERTVHHLLRRGMSMLEPTSPHHAFAYSAFQERATFVSHAHTARRAALHGDARLARICGVIAADEKRHEVAYTRVVARCFDADPDAAVRALADVMRAKVTMPGERMTDGRDDGLFGHFSAVAQRAGVYTASDYANMVEHFVRKWKVAELAGLSGEGRRAQDYVCGLPRKIRRMEELARDREAQKEAQSVSISWVFDRPVRLH